MRTSDETEFRDFVTARLDRWRRTAYLMCQDWHTADDLVAETATKLYRAWPRVRAADNPDAYAQRVLSRVWLDERRRPWRLLSLRERMPERPAPPRSGVEERGELATLLATLARRQRAVLILRFYLDHSVEQTAEILGVSTGTVKSQTARALARLRADAPGPAEVPLGLTAGLNPTADPRPTPTARPRPEGGQ